MLPLDPILTNFLDVPERGLTSVSHSQGNHEDLRRCPRFSVTSRSPRPHFALCGQRGPSGTYSGRVHEDVGSEEGEAGGGAGAEDAEKGGDGGGVVGI